MSDEYTKIDKGICPYCEQKMELPGDWSRICHFCGIKWRFNDDMGPGSYSATHIEGGRTWKIVQLREAYNILDKVADKEDDSNLYTAMRIIRGDITDLGGEI